MDRHTQPLGSERGAILVHTALALLALVAFTTFVVDYGVVWVARNQAQNSADGGALGGGRTLMFNLNAEWPARDAAEHIALQNPVFGEAPDVDPTTDIVFPPPGTGTCPASSLKCIRVDVFRNVARDNPLPVFFGPLAGVNEQGVRATATAQIANGRAANCVAPFGVPQTDPPYSLEADAGTTLVLSPGGGAMTGTGWYQILDVVGAADAGGADETKASIRSCVSNRYGLGDDLPEETGVEATIRDAINDLIDLDPWASVVGTGADTHLVSSCANDPPGRCQEYAPDGSLVWNNDPLTSPRVIGVPVFDQDIFLAEGRIVLVDIFGFFVLPPVGPGASGQNISGTILTYPGVLDGSGTGGAGPTSSFLRALTLVR